MTARRVKHWIQGEGGAAEVLRISYPLVLSHLSFTLQTFVDRLFLTWYSPEALAGAVTGAFATWVPLGLFIGTGEYVTTFVAQYHGAGRPRRIGPAVWQGAWFALLAGVVAAALVPLVPVLFGHVGHEAAVRENEVVYASVLLLGAFPAVLMPTLAGFFAGRGETRVVLAVNVGVTTVNGLLDWLWIFGHGGLPRLGTAGAALATVVAQVLGAVAYVVLILGREHRARYGTGSGWRIEPPLLGRLLRYGVPSGLQYALEVAAFSAFLLIVGKIGTLELAATGIAFNLNGLVFVPMLGLGLGVSAIVGRYQGAGRSDLAERTTWSALGVAMVYMSACSAAYLFAPDALLSPYAAGADPARFPALAAVARVLLRFVAVYSVFDMMNVIFAAGLRGAGDTAYAVKVTVVLALAAMLGPAWLSSIVLGSGIYVAWTFASAYVVLLGLLLLRRFRAGRWKALRVIEPLVPDVGSVRP